MFIKSKEIDRTVEKLSEHSKLDPKFFNYIAFILNKIQACSLSRINAGVNKYIMKPHELSRGRGIKTISKLSEILNELRNKQNYGYIIQKYIENPLLYNNRKFDIRIWTIITSTSPLISWVWQKF